MSMANEINLNGEKFSFWDKSAIVLIALFAFYYLEPFFIWETFAGGIFRNLFGMIPFRTIFGMGIIAVWAVGYSKKVKKSAVYLALSVLLVAVFTVGLAGGADKSSALSLAWLPYFVVAVFIMMPAKVQIQSYRLFVAIFAVTLILPIIYYILTHIGIDIPYTQLQSAEEIKVLRGKYYKLYPFATQLTSQWDPLWQEFRLSGIFDESGRVGTVAGLILASEKFRIKGNWKNTVILVGGILSFSLAFYIIAVIYYLVLCFDAKKYKNIAIILAAIIAYMVFINIKFSDPSLTMFQSRFEIVSTGLAGDNRTNGDFDSLMNNFYKSDTYSLMFGKGDGAIGEIQAAKNIDGSSYKCMIYNFGFVGFGASIIWLIVYALSYAKKRGAEKMQIIAVLMVYMANMYQRPSVFYMGYMIVMFGGILIASQEEC